MTRRLIALALLTALTACGVQPSGVISGGPAPTAYTPPPDAPSDGTIIYLIRDETLTAVRRPGPADHAPTALTALLAGPTPTETTAGTTTDLPPATTADIQTTPTGLTITIDTDVTALSTLAIDQLVCTATTNSTSAPAPITITAPDGPQLPPRTCPLI